MYLEVLLDEFAFLADEGSTRYGSEVYHRLKLLPLILCYATICSETSNVNNAVAIVFIQYYYLVLYEERIGYSSRPFVHINLITQLSLRTFRNANIRIIFQLCKHTVKLLSLINL